MTTAAAPLAATAAISSFIAGGSTARFDPEVMELAESHVLDTLASIVACRDLDAAVVGRRYAMATSGSAGAATILGTSDRASVVDAVFASAMAGHGAEINDFIPSVYVQPGPAVVSASLILAALRGRSGAEFLSSVVVGYELAARIPRALGTRNLQRAGLASHGMAPVFGSAAATAALLGMDRSAVEHVLAACAQQASGSWQWLLDVEHIEKAFVFAGMGARNGVHAVLLVEAGYRGVRRSLDRPGSWAQSSAFTGGDEDPSALTVDLDRPTALHDTAFKRYPVGGPAQPAIQAMLELVGELAADDVEKVSITMPGQVDAFRAAEMPALNLPYLMSLILVDGRLDFTAAQSLERMHGDERVLARMRSVSVERDPRQETGTGRKRAESARVSVQLIGGRRVERFVPYVRGFPSHPMSATEVDMKAFDLLSPELGAPRAQELIERCRALGATADVSPIIALLAHRAGF